ncbi:hypothetical protein [Calidithermus chliarophilus]|uniref:hypothetical protein n=1 Tax=Calidithermus chliarophilus TaxID=52023 RepID=UPI000417D865|nr:hypothetical protein [Calidithermus chliarophilus]
MTRRERVEQLVAEGKLTALEARVLLENLPPQDPLEGAGATEPPPAPNPSFQPLFVFIQEA